VVLAGVLDRFPKLQFILGHWGEVVLSFAERLAAMDAVAGLKRPLREYLRQNLYLTGSGIFSAKLLQESVDLVGVDRILFSTDFPYQYRPDGGARRFLNELSLTEQERAGFAAGNWGRLTDRGARASTRQKG